MDEPSSHDEAEVAVGESDEGPADGHEDARNENDFPVSDRSRQQAENNSSEHLADVDHAGWNSRGPDKRTSTLSENRRRALHSGSVWLLEIWTKS